ncbi:MAG: cyclase family protein [Candidatus Omnitrophica bacterium]|nr:cyclase family protein [Candidatus Omnitrophota bacterium]
MKKLIALSYPIDDETPLYPGTPPVEFKKIKDQGSGDSCNTYYAGMSNHSGTHIEASGHFYRGGRTIADCARTEFFYEKPLIVDCPKDKNEMVEIKDMKLKIGTSAPDILLIKTGFSRHRSDPDTYCRKNPYLSTEAARWLRSNFPGIKTIGIDCISFSSYLHRDIGREIHKILLSSEGEDKGGLLLLEDIYIPADVKKLDQVAVFPVFRGALDASPCVIIGIL